jgi:hypothetical protein
MYLGALGLEMTLSKTARAVVAQDLIH